MTTAHTALKSLGIDPTEANVADLIALAENAGVDDLKSLKELASEHWPTPADRGPGRPPIGRQVGIRIPADLLAWLDEQAVDLTQTRAEFMRDALEYARAVEFHGFADLADEISS
jgi:hypothetical protein